MSYGGKHLVALMPGVAWKWVFFFQPRSFLFVAQF